MDRYKIAANINIVSTSDYTHAETPEKYRENHYILSDEIRKKDFLINSTVKYFIDKFSFPKTKSEVLEEIALDVQTGRNEIEKRCSSFFNFLCRRKVLIPENRVEPARSRQPLFKVGDHIGDLCVLEILANKRHIDVYLAVNENDNTTYVIKLLNQNKAKGKSDYRDELLDLEREYAMLKNVQHIPFISQAYEFNNSSNESAYIKLEHIKGKSLTRFLHQTENLDQSDCFTVIKKILMAFSLLHKSNLVHGDIHPSNILVSEHDKSVKVIDLGLSLELNIEKDEVLRIGGVNDYMPPERINISSLKKFSKEPDLYSDVYQIGLMIYLVLYRKTPFRAFIWEDLAKSIKESRIEYADSSFLNYPVPDQVIRIMKKCLNKNPVKRYNSATEIIEDFEKLVLNHN